MRGNSEAAAGKLLLSLRLLDWEDFLGMERLDFFDISGPENEPDSGAVFRTQNGTLDFHFYCIYY